MRVLHPFHLLTPSVWPLASSLSLFNLAVSLTAYLNSVTGSSLAMLLALMVLVLSIGFDGATFPKRQHEGASIRLKLNGA